MPVGAVRDVAGNTAARRLIEERERQLKGALSRFANQRVLELWGGASGAAPFNYRWGRSQRIVTDIVTALGGA